MAAMNNHRLPGLQRDSQRGAALILALVVTATVVLLAVRLGSDYLSGFRRVENRLMVEQRRQQLLAAEAVARQRLQEDLVAQPKLDALNEPWAQPIQFDTGRSVLTAQLYDLQGRLNLNALLAGNRRADDNPQGENPKSGNGQSADPPPGIALPSGDGAVKSRFNVQQQRLIRLLQVLPMSEPITQSEAELLTEALTDWMDKDDEITGLGGAETSFYEAEDPARRAANRNLRAVSELRWVKGINAELYRQLAPLVTVWPVKDAQLNVNTAPASVLAALNRNGDLAPLDNASVDFLRDLQRDGVEQPAALEQGPLQGRHLDITGLSVSSQYFLMVAEVGVTIDSDAEDNGPPLRLSSVLRRNQKGDITVLARRYGSAWESAL